MTSQPRFEANSPRYRAWVLLFAGSSLTLLASALVGVALRARDRQELMTEQIRDARDALAAAQKEREKLSHDLHDNTIQALYAIQLGLNHTSQKLQADPASARRELSALRIELDAIITEMRRFITAEEGGSIQADLAAVLRALVQRAAVGSKASLELHCEPAAARRLRSEHAVQLANIAREALSNSLRHGQPRHVQLTLHGEDSRVCLEIADDGLGFNPAANAGRGVGLSSMQARAATIGGDLQIQSSPGQGTRVRLCVPAAPDAEIEAAAAASPPTEK